jgi:hypothetical protein
MTTEGEKRLVKYIGKRYPEFVGIVVGGGEGDQLLVRELTVNDIDTEVPTVLVSREKRIVRRDEVMVWP